MDSLCVPAIGPWPTPVGKSLFEGSARSPATWTCAWNPGPGPRGTEGPMLGQASGASRQSREPLKDLLPQRRRIAIVAKDMMGGRTLPVKGPLGAFTASQFIG